jgi:S-adenosylmethionine:tRNA ribosyltransferase-isomerase
VQVSDFHYHLPDDLIAQTPLADRSASRMLRVEKSSGHLSDGHFLDFPALLGSTDLLVLNNTRVLPARLYGRRAGIKSQPLSRRNPAARDFLKGRIEVLLIRQISTDPNHWECLVRPGRKILVGERLFFGENDELQAEVIARDSF